MELTCENCKHYRQHYGKLGRGYRKIGCGHCVYPRLKSRKPDTKACEHFKEKE